MIIVRLMGGLGNQMFQYAMGRSLEIRNKTKMFIDTSFLENRSPGFLKVFRDYELTLFPHLEKNISLVGEMLYDLSFTPLIERHFHYHNDIHNAKLADTHYWLTNGHWQSYKYFEDISDLIREEFTFPDIMDTSSLELQDQIKSENSVMINVRRSDYLTDSLFEDINMDYYEKCVNEIESMVDDPTFYVFSDDIEWCNEHFTEDKYHVVDHSHSGPKFIDYLNLMSCCKHQIIPNSTFAWWAAWLNKNEEKIVMYPSKWFTDSNKDTKDLCPTEWIKV